MFRNFAFPKIKKLFVKLQEKVETIMRIHTFRYITLVFILLLSACSLSAKIRICWLDEMNLSTMISGWDEPKKKFSVEGRQPLTLNGKVFKRGIGTHAFSDFTINLHTNAISFEAIVGMDDRAAAFRSGGTAVFKVYVDDILSFESRLMHANSTPQKIRIRLKNAKKINLVIEDGGDGQHGDHANWVDAKITYNSKGLTPTAFYNIEKIDPFILTPKESNLPSINGPRVYGARPDSPFLYRIPVSGAKPVSVKIDGLPKGLSFDSTKRIITGVVAARGRYTATVSAQNAYGNDKQEFEIVIGDTLLLTPPMGWNSWNAYGLTVNEAIVKKVADMFEETGLVEYGYSYINIDDGWQAPKREADGRLNPNEKFADIKGLSDYIHSKGLKFGIYSSPGQTTCGNFLGSYEHEQQDAESYANWGVDYLKYDWCSYESIAKSKTDLSELQKPYIVMNSALKTQKRDIVYSLCQYGMGKVSEWGDMVGGQLWRTTGDILDTWGTLSSISMAQFGLEKYAGSGKWNDPDMLILGKVGWGKGLRETRLNTYEQYTHMTLWCMLSAPLLLGCDIESMDEYTLSLLKNNEVLAINQDKLGKQAGVVKQDGDVRVLKKILSGNKMAVALINFGYSERDIKLSLAEIGINNPLKIRDVWRKSDLNVNNTLLVKLPAHGSEMYIVTL